MTETDAVKHGLIRNGRAMVQVIEGLEVLKENAGSWRETLLRLAPPKGKRAMAKIKINRAPVLTLWASVVVERVGYKRDEALTLARGLTGLSAQAHGRTRGIFEPAQKSKSKKAKEPKPIKIVTLEFLGRMIPTVRTKEGIRAVSKNSPIKPESVEKYLESKFGDALGDARVAMQVLAKSVPPKGISGRASTL